MFSFKKRAFDRIYSRARDAYTDCGYFNLQENPEHGGPKPNGKNSHKFWTHFIGEEFEDFDDAFDELEADIVASGEQTATAIEKLQSYFSPDANQSEGLTHLRVAYFKWIYRHLGECAGEANHGIHSYRVNRLANELKRVFEDLTRRQARNSP